MRRPDTLSAGRWTGLPVEESYGQARCFGHIVTEKGDQGDLFEVARRSTEDANIQP